MINETNKTSVDYLWNLIPPDIQNMIEKQFNGYEKAKEMEKEQMINFVKSYVDSDAIYCSGEFGITKGAEQYYNETYGGNK
jgi:hypothetical protein